MCERPDVLLADAFGAEPMRTHSIAILAMLTIRLATEAAEGKSPAAKDHSEAELTKLIASLGDKDFRVREQATKRLAEIGFPALDALRKAQQSGDAETRQRATSLTRRITAALPTTVAGLEFKLLADKEWVFPALGKDVRPRVTLQVTNKTPAKYRLNLKGALIEWVLQDSMGKVCPWSGLQARSPSKRFSPTLGENDVFTMP